jgi:SAM-dependent methyltransferase
VDDTRGADYTARLETLSGARWKRWLDVQAPYRWNVRRLGLGFVLDLGCGIGRNLLHLGGHGVGIDTNAHSVEIARRRGCRAYTPEEFRESEFAAPGAFDGLLAAHLLEHLPRAAASALLGEYLPCVRAGGVVALITPQEAGYRSDPTHVEFLDAAALRQILADHGIEHLRSASFPFPRFAGRFFPHNEFVVVGRKPG